MTDLKNLLITLSILGLIVFSLGSFIVTLQSNSNVGNDYKLTNNSLINETFGDLENSLNNQKKSEDSLNSLENVPPEEYIGDLNVASVVSTTRNMKSIIIGVWNIYIKLPIVILGVDPIVASIISTILVSLIAIGIWAIWKGAISF